MDTKEINVIIEDRGKDALIYIYISHHGTQDREVV
jgi:hypothetical protein